MCLCCGRWDDLGLWHVGELAVVQVFGDATIIDMAHMGKPLQAALSQQSKDGG